MDRDRVGNERPLAYKALVLGEGKTAPSAAQAIKAGPMSRAKPMSLSRAHGFGSGQRRSGWARIKDGDVIIFFNFRPDRAAGQLTRTFVDEEFSGV